MSEEWPDDDPRFTGPKCRLDKVGGVASGEFTKRPRGAVKMYALCELVPLAARNHAVGMVVSDRSCVRVVEEFDDEGTAETAARKHAIKLTGEENGNLLTVTVLPVWRAR